MFLYDRNDLYTLSICRIIIIITVKWNTGNIISISILYSLIDQWYMYTKTDIRYIHIYIYIYILTIIYKIGIRKEYMALNQDSFLVHKICNGFTVFYLLIDQENCSHVTVLQINCSGFKTYIKKSVHFDNAGILILHQLAVFNIIIFRK